MEQMPADRKTTEPKPPTVKKTRGKARINKLPVNQRAFLRLDDYADRISVSRRLLDGWIKEANIPLLKIGGAILIDPLVADEAIRRLSK
jgi:hypothetical protein